MLTGLRITQGDVTPSHGLFLTCRGENIYTVYTVQYYTANSICSGALKCKKSLTCGGGHKCMYVRGEPHSALDHVASDCRVSHEPLASPFPQTHPFQPPTPTHITQFYQGKVTSASCTSSSSTKHPYYVRRGNTAQNYLCDSKSCLYSVQMYKLCRTQESVMQQVTSNPIKCTVMLLFILCAMCDIIMCLCV
jgi:hypothetical protein